MSMSFLLAGSAKWSWAFFKKSKAYRNERKRLVNIPFNIYTEQKTNLKTLFVLKLVRMDQQRLLTVLLLHVRFTSRQRQIKNVVRARRNAWLVMPNRECLKALIPERFFNLL